MVSVLEVFSQLASWLLFDRRPISVKTANDPPRYKQSLLAEMNCETFCSTSSSTTSHQQHSSHLKCCCSMISFCTQIVLNTKYYISDNAYCIPNLQTKQLVRPSDNSREVCFYCPLLLSKLQSPDDRSVPCQNYISGWVLSLERKLT